MALEYYEDSDVGASDVFTLSVPSAAISEHLNKYESTTVIFWHTVVIHVCLC